MSGRSQNDGEGGAQAGFGAPAEPEVYQWRDICSALGRTMLLHAQGAVITGLNSFEDVEDADFILGVQDLRQLDDQERSMPREFGGLLARIHRAGIREGDLTNWRFILIDTNPRTLDEIDFATGKAQDALILADYRAPNSGRVGTLALRRTYAEVERREALYSDRPETAKPRKTVYPYTRPISPDTWAAIRRYAQGRSQRLLRAALLHPIYGAPEFQAS